MTLPRAESDLLILAPSLSRAPVAPVLDARSDPAKSTRCSWEVSKLVSRSPREIHEKLDCGCVYLTCFVLFLINEFWRENLGKSQKKLENFKLGKNQFLAPTLLTLQDTPLVSCTAC